MSEGCQRDEAVPVRACGAEASADCGNGDSRCDGGEDGSQECIQGGRGLRWQYW